MIKTKNQIIQDAVKYLKANAHTIKASWNAGGDETLCQVYLEENGQEIEHDFLWQDLQIDWELTDLIVAALDLPNAGEMYNYGNGEITLTSQGDVIITFDAKEYVYAAYDHGQPEAKITALLADPFALKQYTHRANIQLSTEMDEEAHIQTRIEIEVIEGDEILLAPEVIQSIEIQLQQLIKQYAQEGLPIVGVSHPPNIQTCGITMSGQFSADASIEFTLLREYEYLKISNQKKQVLLAYHTIE